MTLSLFMSSSHLTHTLKGCVCVFKGEIKRVCVTCDVTPSGGREAEKLLIMFGSLIHRDQEHIWT